MKVSKGISALVLICFLPNVAFAGPFPYIPAVASPLSATMYAAQESPAMLYASRFSVSPNHFQGNFAESVMRNYFTTGADMASDRRWYSLDPGPIMVTRGGNMTLLDPSKTGRAGFDGLFMQFDTKGNPTGVMVVESKFASSPLGETKYSGRQMSAEWVRVRASKAALHYKRMSNLANGGRIQRSRLSPVSAKIAGKVTQVPLSDKESVAIWWDGKAKSYVYYSANRINDRTLQRALGRVAQTMEGVVEGKITPRKVLWRLDATNGRIMVTRESIDAAGNVIRGSRRVINILSKPYAQLTPQNQALFDEGVVEAISRQRYRYLPEDEARKVALADWERAKQRGEAEKFIREYNPDKMRFAWGTVGKTALKAGLIGGGFTFLLSSVFRLAASLSSKNFSDIDIFDMMRGMTKDIALSFASASGGTLAGMGMAYFLQKQMLSPSQSLIARMIPEKLVGPLSGTVSGLVASAIFAYGYALLNGGNFKEGNRLMLTGTAATAAGAIASYAILQTAMIVGTASTGTAISSLSGAVAVKAAMAWLGGGSVAAGGWGVAGGSVVLSGGTMLVVMAATAAISYGWSLIDENKRLEHLRALVGAYQ